MEENDATWLLDGCQIKFFVGFQHTHRQRVQLLRDRRRDEVRKAVGFRGREQLLLKGVFDNGLQETSPFYKIKCWFVLL